MTKRWARVVRGQSVAVFATFTAAFSHGFADGGHPPIAAVALALAFSSIACVIFAGRHFSQRGLAASVAASQLIYHGLFSLFGTAGPPAGIVTVGHHGAVSFSTMSYSTTGAGQVGAASSDLWMLAAHVGAAVATFALLVSGERSLSTLCSVAALLIAALSWWRLPHIPEQGPHGRRFPVGQRSEIPHGQMILTSSLRHRGPPARPRFA